jgi:signal transduction histidine kinase
MGQPTAISRERGIDAQSTAADCLAGGGAMGALMRSSDWSKTKLGPVAGWPQSLRTAVSIMLDSAFAMVVAWGPEFVFLYNDRYRPVLGSTKHPGALGRPSKEIFPEVWHVIGPLFERTRHGQAVALDDMLIPLDRNGFLEDCYFTLSYSPIRDESGGVGGMLAVVAETTERVQGERRLATLRDLAALGEARNTDEACAQAARRLAGNPVDVPFSLFYLLEPDGQHARLAGLSGLARDSHAAPPVIKLGGDDRWRLRDYFAVREQLELTDLGARFGHLPSGPYEEPTHSALVLPMLRAGHDRPYGFFIAGVSPRCALDDRYRTFLELGRDHIVAALTNAISYVEVRERAEALAEIDRAKTTFFSNVSHEFRTPLTLMLGPSHDLLLGTHGPLRAEQREQLELLHRNGLRLQKLVNSLLDFSRLEAGRLQASYEATDLAAVTRELAEAFRSAIERAGLTLLVDAAPLSEPAFVDRDMWEKIVLNLLSNALKFTFEGRIEVSLRIDGPRFVLRVSDTGVGIPAAELPRLFERFHRVEGSRARTYEGSGIGLALVQELIKMHGGAVHVESAVGTGTAFIVVIPRGADHLPRERIGAHRMQASTVLGAAPFIEEALRWLPAASERAVETEAAHEVPEPEAAWSKDAGAERILLVDDNADIRDYVRRHLERCFRVEAFDSGAKALAAARARPFDLVLTDVMMPGLDGFALLQKLREDERTRRIPVIMLSARSGEEAKVEGLQAGADDYLTKPFSTKELLARVRTHLDLSRLRIAADDALKRERAARQEAERAARFGEMFIGIVGHDLRNPLSAIVMAASSLEARLDSQAAKSAARIVASAERMDRMISQLLDLTSIRLGRGIPLERTRVDMAELARGAIEELQAVHQREIQLEAVGDTCGEWDADRLSQLLSNLVSNACQHGAPNTPALVRLDGSQRDAVVLEVKNRGAIPPALLPFVFEPLRYSGERRAKTSSGLGLGLFIMQQIAQAHGGSIDVQSDDRHGVCFRVRLPRYPAPSASDVFSVEKS